MFTRELSPGYGYHHSVFCRDNVTDGKGGNERARGGMRFLTEEVERKRFRLASLVPRSGALECLDLNRFGKIDLFQYLREETYRQTVVLPERRELGADFPGECYKEYPRVLVLVVILPETNRDYAVSVFEGGRFVALGNNARKRDPDPSVIQRIFADEFPNIFENCRRDGYAEVHLGLGTHSLDGRTDNHCFVLVVLDRHDVFTLPFRMEIV